MNTLKEDIADFLAFVQKPMMDGVTKAELHKLIKWCDKEMKEYQKFKRDLLTAMKKKGK